MRAIKGLAMQLQLQLLGYPSHQERRRPSSSEAIGGAVAIVNLARRALMLVGMSQEEAKQLGVLPSQRWRIFGYCRPRLTSPRQAPDAEWYELRSVSYPMQNRPPTPAVTECRRLLGQRSVGRQQAGFEMSAVEKAVLEVVDAGKLVDGIRVPYSPNKTGAANARGLTDDALAAIRKALGPEMSPEDLSALLDQAVSELKAKGVLVDIEIKDGRFRRGRGLSVEWGNWAAEQPKNPQRDKRRSTEG